MFVAGILVGVAILLSQTSLYHSSFVAASDCWEGTACTGPTVAAFQDSKWEKYNYSPTNRTVFPKKVLSADKAPIADYPLNITFTGNNQVLIFDFGQLTGGTVQLNYTAKEVGEIGLAFSESLNWVGENSDFSNGSGGDDGAILFHVAPTAETLGFYQMPVDKIRGGFRYLTLFTKNSGSTQVVNVTEIKVVVGFAPSWPNLRAYQGYFYSNDDKLNKIWYAGAYTLQTNSVPPKTGRAFPILGGGWENNQSLDLGLNQPTIYVDGSKRDRTVWSGDLTVAIPSILISTGDFAGVKSTLLVLYKGQRADGCLPFAGPAINNYDSDTYHMSTLIGTHDYFIHTNERDFLDSIWERYVHAMDYITKKIDGSGALHVTGIEDWGRNGQGGHNTEAQMLLYRTLRTASAMARWKDETARSSTWWAQADALQVIINTQYWDDSAGAFKESDVDASIHPQDGNSLALSYSVADASKMSKISSSLTKNWIEIGAVSPELPHNIVTFIESIEVKGHFAARQPTRALDLIRRSWGWYLDNPLGTGSTTIEGYRDDGTFGYRSEKGYPSFSYTSHAHGWGSGPTDALTTYLVGLRVTEPGGSSWNLSPQFGDLKHAEAGFTTPRGKFLAAWDVKDDGYAIGWAVPEDTDGTLILPARGGAVFNQTNGPGIMDMMGLKIDAEMNLVTLKVKGSGDISVKY